MTSKRRADDERAEGELVEQMTKLSLDFNFECPMWLKDYCDLAGCADELRELIRYSLINEMIHNILTALKNAIAISGLEEHFMYDVDLPLDARESFHCLFNTALYPHKCNTYNIAATDDPELNTKIEKCVEYLDNVCSLADLENLFVFLETFSQLRLEPLTNPIVVAIHKKLDALPNNAARIAALKLTTEEATGWSNIPDQQNAVHREIYWTRAARAAQAKQMCYNTATVANIGEKKEYAFPKESLKLTTDQKPNSDTVDDDLYENDDDDIDEDGDDTQIDPRTSPGRMSPVGDRLYEWRPKFNSFL